MRNEEDFSTEDDKETQDWMSSSSSSEFKSLVAKMKYNDRRNKLLFLRSLGRSERKRLRAKYAASTK